MASGNATELLQNGTIKSLHELLTFTDSNYMNLHERLGISKHKLTRLLNAPKEEGTMEIVKDISILVGVDASILINTLKIGSCNISIDEMENLHFEETMGIHKSE